MFYFSQRTTNCETKYHSYELECLAVIFRFHIYLQGIHFIIITDCDSFKLTLAKREIVPRIIRWCLLLQNYDYEIEHRSNTKMKHVDALSRVQSILILEGNSFEQELAIKQNLNPEIEKIKTLLENSEHPLFELRNGLVYRKSKNGLQFYVPKSMEFQILHKYHDEMGHVGAPKTLELITRTYWFPSLSDKVKGHIYNCLKYIEYNPKFGKSEGFLHNILKGSEPFQCLHIDHYGPLVKTSANNKYIPTYCYRWI